VPSAKRRFCLLLLSVSVTLSCHLYCTQIKNKTCTFLMIHSVASHWPKTGMIKTLFTSCSFLTHTKVHKHWYEPQDMGYNQGLITLSYTAPTYAPICTLSYIFAFISLHKYVQRTVLSGLPPYLTAFCLSFSS